MKPYIGRIVNYTLGDYDVDRIRQQRDINEHLKGNSVSSGDIFPMIIVRVWNFEPGTVNGVVLLDGNDTLWVSSVIPGQPREPNRYFDPQEYPAF